MKRNDRSAIFSESHNGADSGGRGLADDRANRARRRQWTGPTRYVDQAELPARAARRRRASATRADACFGRRRSGGTAGRVKPATAGTTGTLSPADVQERLRNDPNDPLFLHDGLDDGVSGTSRITRARDHPHRASTASQHQDRGGSFGDQCRPASRHPRNHQHAGVGSGAHV